MTETANSNPRDPDDGGVNLHKASDPIEPATTPAASSEQTSVQDQVPPPYAPPSQYGYAPYQPQAPLEGLALASLITSLAFFVGFWFISSILGVVFGHIALHNIKKTGRRGRGLALGGLITGYVTFGISLLVTLLIITVAIFGIGASNSNRNHVRADVRDEVATLISLEATGDITSIVDQAGTHTTSSGTHVTVMFNDDYTMFTVSGNDPDFPYTYKYDSTTGEYQSSDSNGRFDGNYDISGDDQGQQSGLNT